MGYQWSVIGAGPAGIATIGKLLDFGIPESEILWIDPTFTVGDFGTLWRHVPSNTKVGLFLDFLYASEAFNYKNCSTAFEINDLPKDQTCHLHSMAEPLQWITEQLQQRVKTLQGTVQKLAPFNNAWHLYLHDNQITSRNVVLAIGSEPKVLNYTIPHIIPLHDAMDHHRLSNHLQQEDSVAVFGSSHSAILIIKNLVSLGVAKIINFYRSPLRYAVQLEDYILFDDTGLKGSTAIWARKFIDKQLPKNLERIFCNDENVHHYLPLCNKVIYAVGFERRMLPVMETFSHYNYVEQCGIISPGLFGIGIAFPEARVNPIGIKEYRVGLWKFMEYLNDVLPIWLKYKA